MPRLYEKVAALGKTEVTYGVDPVATGVANALLFTNVSVTPLAGGVEDRGLLTPMLGNTGVIPNGTHVRFEGDIEVAGAGAAGTAPAWGVLLKACGMSEVISAGVDVKYQPVSNGFTSLSLAYFADGVKHLLSGVRGTWKADFNNQKIPKIRFSFTGLYSTPTDAALPAVTLTGWKRPVIANKASTTLALHGVSVPVESLMVDLGLTIEPRLLINYEGIEITDRKSVGRVQIEAGLVATKDWFTTHLAGTRAVMALQHGTVAGNIVKIDAPVVEVGAPEQGASGKILNYGMPLYFVPNAGDDELVVTVK